MIKQFQLPDNLTFAGKFDNCVTHYRLVLRGIGIKFAGIEIFNHLIGGKGLKLPFDNSYRQ